MNNDNIEGKNSKKHPSELKYPLPSKDVGFKKNLEIISAYVVGSSFGKTPVGYMDLKPYVSFSPIAISGSNKFFEHVGIIQAVESSNQFLPTALAIEIQNTIKWKNDASLKTLLRKSLKDSWFWNHTQQLLSIKDTIDRKLLIEKLGEFSRASPKTHLRSLGVILEYLIYSDLLVETDGQLTINTSNPNIADIQSNLPSQIPTISQQPNDDIVKRSYVLEHPLLEKINFNVIINPGMSDDEIRRSVHIVIDEITKIQNIT